MSLRPWQELWWQRSRARAIENEMTVEQALAVWDRERWPNFAPHEFSCRGSGKLVYEPVLFDRIQAIRIAWRAPIVTKWGEDGGSVYRTPEHNAAEGGGSRSMHMLGLAADVRCPPTGQPRLIAVARQHGVTAIGRYSWGLHLDLRPWGEVFWRG